MTAQSSVPTRESRERLVGAKRAEIAAFLAKEYLAGATIRTLMSETRRSYCFVYRLLTKDAGLTLRGRGGNTRGPKA